MEILGFIVILLGGAMVIRVIGESITDPKVVEQIAQSSPFIADHSDVLYWVSTVILTIILLMIPIYLKNKQIESLGDGGMALVGRFAMYWIQGVVVCLGIISLGYLLGVGWTAATIQYHEGYQAEMAETHRT